MSAALTRPLLLVGCGKMGSALLAGWRAQGVLTGMTFVVEPMMPGGLVGDPNLSVLNDDTQLPVDLQPEVVVFAVKPQIMGDVAPPYRRFAGADTLFLSIAAGTPIRFFEQALGEDAAIVRAMPNTPAAIGQGITVACPNAKATAAQASLAKQLLEAVGEASLIDDEDLMDAVTAVSGSGPAYVFLLIETLARAGVEAGLAPDLAARLALKTVAGAGALAVESDLPPETLRENVTSPGGTTFAALQVLMADDGLQPLMTRAIAAAVKRGKELAG
jgi:pyrroline-5-carboxylate reductase